MKNNYKPETACDEVLNSLVSDTGYISGQVLDSKTNAFTDDKIGFSIKYEDIHSNAFTNNTKQATSLIKHVNDAVQNSNISEEQKAALQHNVDAITSQVNARGVKSATEKLGIFEKGEVKQEDLQNGDLVFYKNKNGQDRVGTIVIDPQTQEKSVVFGYSAKNPVRVEKFEDFKNEFQVTGKADIYKDSLRGRTIENKSVSEVAQKSDLNQSVDVPSFTNSNIKIDGETLSNDENIADFMSRMNKEVINNGDIQLSTSNLNGGTLTIGEDSINKALHEEIAKKDEIIHQLQIDQLASKAESCPVPEKDATVAKDNENTVIVNKEEAKPVAPVAEVTTQAIQAKATETTAKEAEEQALKAQNRTEDTQITNENVQTAKSSVATGEVKEKAVEQANTSSNVMGYWPSSLDDKYKPLVDANQEIRNLEIEETRSVLEKQAENGEFNNEELNSALRQRLERINKERYDGKEFKFNGRDYLYVGKEDENGKTVVTGVPKHPINPSDHTKVSLYESWILDNPDIPMGNKDENSYFGKIKAEGNKHSNIEEFNIGKSLGDGKLVSVFLGRTDKASQVSDASFNNFGESRYYGGVDFTNGGSTVTVAAGKKRFFGGAYQTEISENTQIKVLASTTNEANAFKIGGIHSFENGDNVLAKIAYAKLKDKDVKVFSGRVDYFFNNGVGMGARYTNESGPGSNVNTVGVSLSKKVNKDLSFEVGGNINNKGNKGISGRATYRYGSTSSVDPIVVDDFNNRQTNVINNVGKQEKAKKILDDNVSFFNLSGAPIDYQQNQNQDRPRAILTPTVDSQTQEKGDVDYGRPVCTPGAIYAHCAKNPNPGDLENPKVPEKPIVTPKPEGNKKPNPGDLGGKDKVVIEGKDKGDLTDPKDKVVVDSNKGNADGLVISNGSHNAQW